MKNKKLRIIQIGTFLLSFAFIGIGIYRGEHLEVMEKAIKICFSCIGLG